GLVDTSLNLFFVELGKHLALLNFIAVIDVELLHDAAGLGLDLDLRDGLDFAGRHHAFCEVSSFDLGELRGVDLGAAAGVDQHPRDDQNQNGYCDRAVDDSLTPLLPAIAVTIAVAVACHDRLLPDFKSENRHSPV